MKLRTVLVAMVGLVSGLLAGTPAHADMVLDWNAKAAQLIVGPGGAAKVPPLGLIDLAIVHTAIYDAVNAIEEYPFQPYAIEPAVYTPASAEAATAAAGRDVLVALYPERQVDIDALYAASLATIPDGPAKTNGISVGQQTAAGILALRANDGRNAGTPIAEPLPGDGVWVRTPPGFLPPQAPWTRYVTPWLMESPSQFRSDPPPSLASHKWVRAYNEVKNLGPAVGDTRAPEQTDIGRFWSDQPMLQWNRAWRGISIGQGLSLLENARFFAMLSTASSDALIACWDGKYEYMFWRPVTAIRDGGGNPDLMADPNWIGLVITPNHPEYPGAHGCFSGASTKTLAKFFGTDRFDFTIDSAVSGLSEPVRSYERFSDALEEVLDARIYGGMHYDFSNNAGAKIGRSVSRLAAKRFRERHHQHQTQEAGRR